MLDLIFFFFSSRSVPNLWDRGRHLYAESQRAAWSHNGAGNSSWKQLLELLTVHPHYCCSACQSFNCGTTHVWFTVITGKFELLRQLKFVFSLIPPCYTYSPPQCISSGRSAPLEQFWGLLSCSRALGQRYLGIIDVITASQSTAHSWKTPSCVCRGSNERPSSYWGPSGLLSL